MMERNLRISLGLLSSKHQRSKRQRGRARAIVVSLGKSSRCEWRATHGPRSCPLNSILALCWSLCNCGTEVRSASTPQPPPNPQGFSCPSGQTDVMQYFVMGKQYRDSQFMNGQPNPIYTEVFPDQDFAASGYWFWLKSAGAHGSTSRPSTRITSTSVPRS
jgi:hypothetical protein